MIAGANATTHTLLVGDCRDRLAEIESESIHLIVTSPPYFNAPFDYQNLFDSYDEYLSLIDVFAKESFRVLDNGRIAVINADDMLVNSRKYPIVADITKLFLNAGFTYRDRIIWRKPEGYVRISRRSGVLIQNPYPLYFYPDNICETILIFQKGKFDYRSIDRETREASRIDVQEFNANKWNISVWDMTNVLPSSKLEKGIAAFPYELPYRAIKLFSYIGETVFDPFCGSGTTLLAALKLNRNSIGIEINSDCVATIKEKVGDVLRVL